MNPQPLWVQKKLVNHALRQLGKTALPKVGGGRTFQESSTSLERLAGLEDDLDLLEETSGVASLAVDDPDPDDVDEAKDLRLSAVHARLQLLGYVGRDVPVTVARLRRPVREFQRESGITEDGWVGRETWGRLEGLITLEPVCDFAPWFTSEGPRPALIRAVAVRLTSLGLYRGRISSDLSLQALLAPFDRVAREIDLIADDAEVRPRQLVQLLFDHPLQIHVLGVLEPTRLPVPASPLVDVDESCLPAAHRFVLNLARAELWLAGYEPGRVGVPLEAAAAPGRAEQLIRALTHFWRDHDEALDPQQARARAARIDAPLFNAFLVQRQVSKATPEEVSTFIERNQPRLEEAWHRAASRNPVFFLWDGVQRGLRWLGGRIHDLAKTLEELIERGMEYVRTLLWNVFRAAYTHVAEVLSGIRHAVKVFVRGMSVYLRGHTSLLQPAPGLHARLHLDGDTHFVFPEGASHVVATGWSNQLRAVPESLSTASLILSGVLGALADVAKGGPAAWVLIAIRLFRDGPRLITAVRTLAALDDEGAAIFDLTR